MILSIIVVVLAIAFIISAIVAAYNIGVLKGLSGTFKALDEMKDIIKTFDEVDK